MNKPKVAIIGSVGIPAKYGGFETLVEFLANHLNEQFDITVYCSSVEYPEKLKEHYNCQLEYVPLKANGIQSIPYDIWSLLKIRRSTKIVLILGVASGLFLPFYKIFYRKKIILNVDGLEWKREKWGKMARWYLRIAEKIAVKNADIVISDNKVIQGHILDSYGKQSVLIPYGGDHAQHKVLSEELTSKYDFLKRDYAIKVCRIEPENNVQMILDAFTKINLDIVIIGNWMKSEYGITLRKDYSKHKNIHLLDPIYDLDILDQLRSNCFFYVHGHSAGGTNPSLVEAMNLGLPILAFDVNYNIETTEDKAIYFKNTEDLIKKINENSIKEHLIIVGKNMAHIAERRYSWSVITKKYGEVFIT